MATPLFHDGLTVHTQNHDYPIVITEKRLLKKRLLKKMPAQQSPWQSKLRPILVVNRY